MAQGDRFGMRMKVETVETVEVEEVWAWVS